MSKLITSLLLGLLSISACDAQLLPPTTQWEAGKTYFVVDPPQPTASGSKIEVLEVFSYACSHCAHFQPYAEELISKLPTYAAYSYMPAIFNPSWEPFARAYYTAQSLGVADKTHQALFDALHRDHEPIRDINGLADFYATKGGVDPHKFIAASTSFEVESKLSRSLTMVPKFGVDGTPTIIVNGKYRVTAASAGGYPQLIDEVLWLVQKEHDAAAKPAKK